MASIAKLYPHMDDGDHIYCCECTESASDRQEAHPENLLLAYWLSGRYQRAPADKILDGRFPERVISKAVRGDDPAPLSRKAMSHLHIYAGAEHPHAAQQPEILDVASMNTKNSYG